MRFVATRSTGIVLALLLSACETAPVVRTAAAPSAAPAELGRRMSLPEAQKAISEAVVITGFFVEPPTLHRRSPEAVEIYTITGVTFSADKMIIGAKKQGSFFDGPAEQHEVPFADLKTGHVNYEGTYIVNLDRRSEEEPGYAFVTRNGDEYSQGLIDALAVLQNEATRRNDVRFAEIAKTYRDAVPRPALPEDARRYRVQAEAAIRDKNFVGAAELYANGLVLAPWWPEGRYNRALIMAELKEFETAIAEMKRYLLLGPPAAEARSAQDRIYEWEVKVPAPNVARPRATR